MKDQRAPAEGHSTATLILEDPRLAHSLAGERNANFKALRKELKVKADLRGNQLFLQGEDHLLDLAKRVIHELYELLKKGYPVYPQDVSYAVQILAADHRVNLADIFLDKVFISGKDRIVTPKSIAQKEYVDAIRKYDIVFGVGPAGTGKTFLAMALAVSEFNAKRVKRIILTRPAVEAGERLGFLPGDLKEKVDPYLRPLYDALHDMMDFEKAARLVDRGVIEVAPLAFMRGRTLNDAFVILDEAQNTTREQMKMFLTRLGEGSRMAVTGDMSQIDLPSGTRSGLVDALDVLDGVAGVSAVRFSDADVVRHPLVTRIVRAYNTRDARQQERDTQ